MTNIPIPLRWIRVLLSLLLLGACSADEADVHGASSSTPAPSDGTRTPPATPAATPPDDGPTGTPPMDAEPSPLPGDDPTPISGAWPLPELPYSGPGLWLDGSRPPDPQEVAPQLPLDGTDTTDRLIGFLTEGDSPIQRGVESGALKSIALGWASGQVFTRDGLPLEGVEVSVVGRPDLGSTLTLEDGRFDLAVNGGAWVILRYDRAGYLPAHRRVGTTAGTIWQRAAATRDLVMVPFDTQATLVQPGTSRTVAARSSPTSDESGSRQPVLLFAPGTVATLELPTGERRTLEQFTVRATEYTLGSGQSEDNAGPSAMPAELPATSAYTYAVELTLDEALEAGARASFSQPVGFYLENFLNLPVGWTVPSGSYDRARAVWVPEVSGRVVALLEEVDGQAVLDVDGSGQPASAEDLEGLGISESELQTVAELYAPGQSLWRLPITHFSPHDFNYSPSPPGPDNTAAEGETSQDAQECDSCLRSGSIIDVHNQVLGEQIPVVGTPFVLNYRSDTAPGFEAAYSVDVTLTGAPLPTALLRVELETSIAGQTERRSWSPVPNLSHRFTWDGKDAFGRELRGAQALTLRIGYVYPGGYTQAEAFAAYGGDPSVSVQTGRNAITFWTRKELWLGTLDVQDAGLGGWSLDVHHRFDVNRAQLYRGDGSRVRRHREAYVIRTLVGDFEHGEPQPESALAEDVRLGTPCGLAQDSEGNLYVAEPEYHVVRKVTPRGELSIFAGTFGVAGDGGDGLGATSAQLDGPCELAFGPDGSLYIADEGNQRLRRVDPDGTIVTVMGGFRTTEGEGMPASQASLPASFGLEVDEQGVVYLAEPNNDRVRRIRPDGLVETIVGNGERGNTGDGGPALEATLNRPEDITVAPDGGLLIVDSGNYRVRRLDPSGVLDAYLGSGGLYPDEEGGPALEVSLGEPISLAVDAQGQVFVASDPDAVVLWRLGADGWLVRVAGTNEESWVGYSQDELAGRDTNIFSSPTLLVDGNGDLLYSEDDFARVRRLIGPFRHYDTEGFWLPSERSPVLYHFNAAGRHLETVHAKTGATLFSFEYDEAGLLSTIEDGDGLRTLIEREADGLPRAIVAPFGQRTSLGVDDHGWLDSVTDPSGQSMQLEHSERGLLQRWWHTSESETLHEAHYDALGRLEQETGPDGASLDLVRSGTNGEITVGATTAEGRLSTYTLLPQENGAQWRSERRPDGLLLEERRGLLKREIDHPDGTEVRIREVSDPRFGLSAPGLASFELTTPSGLTGTLSRSYSVGLAESSDPMSLSWEEERLTWNGATFIRKLDVASLTETLQSPEGRIQTRTYDSLGRVRSRTIPGLEPVHYGYDEAGRLSTISRGERTRTFLYNEAGWLEAIKDPLSRVTELTVDSNGRATALQTPDGRVLGLRYDPRGNLEGVSPPERSEHLLDWSPGDRLSGYVPPALEEVSGAQSWTYDADGALVQALLDGEVRLTWTWDGPSGRLLSLSHPDATITLDYNEVGQVETATSSDGLALHWTRDGPLLTEQHWQGLVNNKVVLSWDENFRLDGEQIGQAPAVDYGYDADGLLVSAGALTLMRDPENGLLEGSTLGFVSDGLEVNGHGEPVAYAVSWAGESLYSLSLQRDGLGRVTDVTESVQGGSRTWGFEFDDADRLATVRLDGEVREEYLFDANGNRIWQRVDGVEAIMEHDAQDRLLQQGTVSYQWNAWGQLEARREASTGAEITYHYDAVGQLREVSLADGRVIRYLIDPLGRRVGKTVDGTLQQAFLYGAGGRLVAELDGAGRLVSQFVYASRGQVPDLMVRGGSTYRLVSDWRGSVRLVIDVDTGEVVHRRDYDAWGKVVSEENAEGAPLAWQPFGFAGGLYDGDTGLVRFGVRDYDAETGRWIAKDPIGFGGGDGNLYAYVGGDPVNFVDPGGLHTEIIVWQPVTWTSSSFGHISANVNGENYSWGPGGWDTNQSAAVYADRQARFRSGVGIILDLSPAQEAALVSCYRSHPGSYGLLTNNCGDPHIACLEEVTGVNASDSLFPVSIGDDLLDSALFSRSTSYEGPSRGPWDDAPWAK